jgi:hypothetical protein
MRFRLLAGAALVVASLVTGTTGLIGSTAVASGSSGYTCTGGSIQSGTYANIRVTGQCHVERNAVINVLGNINVEAGALLDAQSAPSTITVGGNVTAGSGSLLGLGCQANTAHSPHPCAIQADGHSVITVKGNVEARNAFLVLLNGITVNKNVTLTGGGGGGSGFADWAEKNDTIGGNLTIRNVTADWLGVEFSTIGGYATLSHISAIDPGDDGFGAVSIVVNTVTGDLRCEALGPRLSGGIFDGEHNTVGGQTYGQCIGLVGSSS